MNKIVSNHTKKIFLNLLKICFIIFLFTIIWLAPAWMILTNALVKPETATLATDPAKGLLSTPPPWLATGQSATRWLELTWHSLRLGLAATALAVPLGTILGLVLTRTRWPLRGCLKVFWQAMIFLPLPIVAAAWLGAVSNLGRAQLFGISDTPLLTGWCVAALVHALAAVPLVAWLQGNVMLLSDLNLEEMARLEHATLPALFKTTVRQSLPSAAAAALAVLIMTIGDMTVSDLVQERTFAEEAYLQAQMGDGLHAAARTALPPTLVMISLIIAWSRFNRQWLATQGARLGRKLNHSPWLSGPLALPAALVTILATSFIWGVPLAALVWRAGRSGGNVLKGHLPSWSAASLVHNLRQAWPDLADTLPATLMIATLTALFATTIAWLLAWQTQRHKIVAPFLAGSVAFGLAVPGPVAGLAVAWVWMPWQSLYDSPMLIIAAQLFRLTPIAVLMIWPAISFRSRELMELAEMDQLSFLQRFTLLEWPSVGPVAVAAAGVVFALSLGELPATNIVAPPGVEMLSVRLWSLMHTGMESHLAAVVLLASVLLGSGLIMVAVGRNLWRIR